MSTYRCENGRIVEVHDDGLDGKAYGSAWRALSGSWHRYRSLYLPMRATRAEAQADLDAYAEARGWVAEVTP